MGVDLTLIPLRKGDFTEHDHCAPAHTLLDIDRDHRLWPKIEVLYSFEIPQGKLIGYMGHDHDDPDREIYYGDLDEDRYGVPLRWVEAELLAKVFRWYSDWRINVEEIDWVANTNWRAVAGYLEGLDPTTPVVLFWR
jgi:hypothetical protein